MLPIYGYAHHPYTYPAAQGPYYRPANRDEVPIGVLPRLTTAIRLAARARAIPARVPIYLTEYGVQTKPSPLGVPEKQQAEYAALSERIAWEDPNVAAFSQYLLRDEAPHGRLVGYRTGLETPTGKPKPSYLAFAVSLAVTRTRSGYSLWGLVRPTVGATHVRVLFEPDGSRHYRTLRSVATDGLGYWRLHTAVRGSAWRVSWTSPSGVVYNGPPIHAL